MPRKNEASAFPPHAGREIVQSRDKNYVIVHFYIPYCRFKMSTLAHRRHDISEMVWEPHLPGRAKHNRQFQYFGYLELALPGETFPLIRGVLE
jgi:hypothetical protein